MEPEIEFIDQSIMGINENTPRINQCLDQLSEEEIWRKPNSSSNSIGNLILHLSGNITQYIISSLGNQEDNRERDQEFLCEGGFSKTELIGIIIHVVEYYSYHTGQIAFYTKLLKDRDLGFYAGFELNTKNKTS